MPETSTQGAGGATPDAALKAAEVKTSESDATLKAEGESPEDVTFTAAQQKRLQELIDGAYAKGVRRREKEFQHLGAEVARLKGDDGAAKEGEAAKQRYTADEVAKLLQARDQRHEQELQRWRVDKVASQAAILRQKLSIGAALAGAGKYAEDAVEVIIARGWAGVNEDGEVIYTPPEGVSRISDQGTEVDVNEYVGRILDVRLPNMKEPVAQTKGTGTSGGGAMGRSRKGFAGMTRDDIHRMAVENPKEFDRRREEVTGRVTVYNPYT